MHHAISSTCNTYYDDLKPTQVNGDGWKGGVDGNLVAPAASANHARVVVRGGEEAAERRHLDFDQSNCQCNKFASEGRRMVVTGG